MLVDLLLSMSVWLVYFSLIFFPLRWGYDRIVGPRPPDHPKDRLAAWVERQTKLRRRFIAVGVGLAVLPLVLRVLMAM